MSKFLHFCIDWDGLQIDETWPEFDCCSCFTAEEKNELKNETK